MRQSLHIRNPAPVWVLLWLVKRLYERHIELVSSRPDEKYTDLYDDVSTEEDKKILRKWLLPIALDKVMLPSNVAEGNT